jgi:hypothetical protein
MQTLYNHIRLDSEKPLIKNIEFKQMCDKLREGKFDEYDKLNKVYSMSPCQHKLAKQVIENYGVPDYSGWINNDFVINEDVFSKIKNQKLYAKAGEIVKVISDYNPVAICEKQNGERFSTLFTNLKPKP